MSTPKPTRFANLIRKIHPPLPMTPRESQQLKNTISISFREQLDKEYPRSTLSTSGHSDAHVLSLLQSPHFSTAKSSQKVAASRRKGTASTSSGDALEELQTYLLRPGEHFRQQVAAGEATLETAKQCLKIQMDNSELFKEVNSKDTTSAARDQVQPGRLVANWLWSTGLEDSLEFVHDLHFLANLVHCLHLEGCHARVTKWVQHTENALVISAKSGSVDRDLLEAGRSLFKQHTMLLMTELGLGEALQLFTNLVSAHEQPVTHKLRAFYTGAGKKLYAELVKGNAKVTTSQFDSYKDSITKWAANDHLANNALAFLELVHPTNPDPSKAIRMLEQVEKELHIRPLTSASMDKIIRLQLRTAELLVSQERPKEAERVLRLMRRFSPDKFDSHTRFGYLRSDNPNRGPRLQQLVEEALATG